MSYFKASVGAAMALALTACGTTMPQSDVRVPQALLQQCQPLHKLEGMSGADMLRNIVANAEVYYECRDAHEKLIKAVQPDKK